MTLRVLLDTHVYLWWLNDDANLSISARDCIADTDSIVHISAATVWEVSVKSAAGRLDLGETDVLGAIEANGFTELPITAATPRTRRGCRDITVTLLIDF